ncbi:hypothetical protein IFO70_33580 [Phormidium tenue FACHB-886]|nr:hypothetical protein [Phormidium tenue FACHB-886]
MAKETVQAQQEVVEARIYTLDRCLTERLDRATQIVKKLSERMDVLTVQVTQFNSGMTEAT